MRGAALGTFAFDVLKLVCQEQNGITIVPARCSGKKIDSYSFSIMRAWSHEPIICRAQPKFGILLHMQREA